MCIKTRKLERRANKIENFFYIQCLKWQIGHLQNIYLLLIYVMYTKVISVRRGTGPNIFAILVLQPSISMYNINYISVLVLKLSK